jgi:hypothetical protein
MNLIHVAHTSVHPLVMLLYKYIPDMAPISVFTLVLDTTKAELHADQHAD